VKRVSVFYVTETVLERCRKTRAVLETRTEYRARAINGTGVSMVPVLRVSYVCYGPMQLGWLKYERNSAELYGSTEPYLHTPLATTHGREMSCVVQGCCLPLQWC
jgi:hypothetical protein